MADSPEHSSLLQEAQRTARKLYIDGVPWLVYEFPLSAYDRRHGPSLVFESELAVRRVRTYPSAWRQLSDTDLWALSWTS